MKRFHLMISILVLSLLTIGLAHAVNFKVNLSSESLGKSPFGLICLKEGVEVTGHCRLNAELMVSSDLPGEELIVVQFGTWIELKPSHHQGLQPFKQHIHIQPVELPDIVVEVVSETVANTHPFAGHWYASSLNGE